MKIPRPREGVSVGACVRAYTKHLQALLAKGEYSADHFANVRRDLTRFEVFVGATKDVGQCRQSDLTEWIALNPQWESINTKRNAVGAVTSCFNFAQEEELISRSPYLRPRAIKNASAKPRRPATAGEYLALFRGGSRALRNALFFLRETGARTCEMREALWTDLTLGTQPHIILFKHKTARKTGRGRVIALNMVVARFLEWMQRRATSLFIFTNCENGSWDRHTFARHLRRTAERLGLDDGVAERVSGYCLRHTYTCAALTAGFTSKEVADQLGHVDTKMVERVYGSHTIHNLEYLTRTADSIRRKRA